MSVPRLIIHVWILVLSTGCITKFAETHYFRSRPAGQETRVDPGDVNYYRLSIRGCTFFSSSRYLSGYFSPEAIDVYFNEIKQPKNAALRGSDKPAEGGNGASPPVESISPSLEDKDLVLILSTKSEDISNQIGALAANQRFADSLTGLLNREDILRAQDVAARTDADRKSLLDTLSYGEVALSEFGSLSASDMEIRLLTLLNRLASDLDQAGPFTTVEAARDWFKQHRSRLLDGR